MTLLFTDSDKNLDKDYPQHGSSFDGRDGMFPSLTKNDEFTVKIVLTLQVEAPNREQAEVLASHVAAFLPEDAQRVADAFSPVIVVSQVNKGQRPSSRDTRTRSAVATASVTMVANSTPEGAALPSPSDPTVMAVARFPRGVRSDYSLSRSRVRSAVRAADNPRKSVYTRRSF